MTFATPGYKLIRQEFRNYHLDCFDKEGSAVEFLFFLAEFIWHTGEQIPRHWYYTHPQYCYCLEEPSDIFADLQVWHVLQKIVTIPDIVRFGNVLEYYSRYVSGT